MRVFEGFVICLVICFHIKSLRLDIAEIKPTEHHMFMHSCSVSSHCLECRYSDTALPALEAESRFLFSSDNLPSEYIEVLDLDR